MDPFILSLLLGLSHGIEPDHVATARLLKSRWKIVQFALSHSAGFVIIAIPLVILIGDNKFLEIISNIIGIIFSILLLIQAIFDKEIDIGANKAGLLQGAFVITPTKVLVIVIASTAYSILYSIEVISVFIIASAVSIISLSLLNFVPKRVYKIVDVGIALLTMTYLIFLLIN
ncbi:hypothetical protein SULI_03925 [Saccharolobus solfataricus]|uniref:Nickel/cobalt efflux system n=3 Tax=Saccharolobus solfataricus TaxID=2287 RepID=Q97UL9_SACS2|nr:hypothetical protein [Saccharolobus solfataricus]AAK43089.1 Hypothetical protein SSO2984 [Saccharolobus solfataricus P2]AKA73142.1 hypothetical protein SULB_0771 [Saccharolobus solfataricus]AKA75840.1 hypothetical protein SULC_0769 [Saccharolobus solfataricus]AKA78532.1 hypothetical protein SULA_0769 [Saccharolobus solfataricus]AZF67643.1 hypothetical protein SULG_03925 [Saccharolobus solfataricus]